MDIRLSAEDARWNVREAAWSLEERVLWRGSDAAQRAAERAVRAVTPLQRLIQTKLAWPLADSLHDRSEVARTAIATSAVALALAAGTAGALTYSHEHAADHAGTPAPLAAAPVVPESATPALQGVVPQFQPGHAQVPQAAAAPDAPSAPPARVSWRFAQAFVSYEVGQGDKVTTAAFNDTATHALAKSLATDPPRLPSGHKVPKARVLNVVLANASKTQITASVSLVRLRAMSEVRLTLVLAHNEWRVAQVLG
jgi:hypothetical protein